MERSELEGMLLSELHEVAADKGVGGYRSLRKEELVSRILEQSSNNTEDLDDDSDEKLDAEADSAPAVKGDGEEPDVPEPIRADEFWESEPEPEPEKAESESEEEKCAGMLDIRPEGYGLLRVDGFEESPNDIYISASQIRRLALRRGDQISGPLRAPRRGEKHAALRRVDSVNGIEADDAGKVVRFESLTSIAPSKPLGLKAGRGASAELKQLESIKKGERVLIELPTGADGSSTIAGLAKAVAAKSGDSVIYVLLVDTPPERGSDLEGLEGVQIADVSYDHARKNQRQRAEFVLECCKRAAEQGKDAVLIVDCLTDLGRAYGSDLTAVHRTKRFFGAGRSIKDGAGSITMVATVRGDSDLPSDRAMTQDLMSIATSKVSVKKDS